MSYHYLKIPVSCNNYIDVMNKNNTTLTVTNSVCFILEMFIVENFVPFLGIKQN